MLIYLCYRLLMIVHMDNFILSKINMNFTKIHLIINNFTINP